MDGVILALRGAAAIGVMLALVGGMPWIVHAGLAIGVGLWSAFVVGGTVPDGAWIAIAARELVIGATIGVIAGIPLVAAATAGRLIDGAVGQRTRGPYGALFSVLAAAVFVGIDGHVAVVTAIVESYRGMPAVVTAQPQVIAALGTLVPAAIGLAVPWLVTAVVVEIAAGAAMRLAGRAAGQLPVGAAAPAALVMITASLVGTLAVAIAALVRGAT